jgi:hypothetical protein
VIRGRFGLAEGAWQEQRRALSVANEWAAEIARGGLGPTGLAGGVREPVRAPKHVAYPQRDVAPDRAAQRGEGNLGIGQHGDDALGTPQREVWDASLGELMVQVTLSPALLGAQNDHDRTTGADPVVGDPPQR